MIITNVCLLLEALSIVICLHHLYGEKFRLDIDTICLLAVDIIMMQTIDYFGWSSAWSFFIYPMIFIYCGRKFGFKVKVLIINLLLCVVIVGGIQLIVAIPFYYLLKIQSFDNYKLLIVNLLAFLLVTLFPSKIIKNKKLSVHLDKEKVFLFSLITCIAIIAFCVFNYKKFKLIELNQAILLFASIVFIFILANRLSVYKIKAKEAETELKMQKVYADSFNGLINNIRLRQHEFDNHINAIYSQHYIYKTYEELVDAQRNYCQMILKENRFNKLLSSGNPIIVGFLYGKFIEIEKMGIEIEYKVNAKNLDIEIPVHKIVEILGDLLNNAVEALMVMDGKRNLYIGMEDNNTIIEVRNRSPYIDYSEIMTFFIKGYSKKGDGRGLGLYNVKQICNENELDIICQNIEEGGVNWLTFRVVKKKGTIRL